MTNFRKTFLFLIIGLLSSYGLSSKAVSTEDVQSTVRESTTALDELMARPEESVPVDLLHAAKCVSNLHIVKAGFILGGRLGRGVVSCRNPNGNWSNPVFIDLISGSWGFQVGIEVVDLTLVFTNQNAQQSFNHGNFTLDASGGLAVGPKGRDLSGGTNYKLEDAIYSYSRAKGLFIGLTLEGSVLKADQEYNNAAYGSNSPADIFLGVSAKGPASVQPYTNALSSYSK